MALNGQSGERALITSVSREGRLKSGSGLTVRNLGIAAFLMGLLFFANLLNLAPPRRTIGLALSYTLFSVAPPLVLSLIEYLTRPAGPRKSAKRWLLHFQIMLANSASVIPFTVLAAYLASVLVKLLGLNLGIIDLRVADGKGLAPLIGAFLISVLIFDFCFYWYQRSLHKSRILWQHHKMHHMDPEFDALTGPRQNWLENFFSVFFISIPMAVLFKLDAIDPLNAGLINGAIIGLLQSIVFINHSNLRLQFGRASVVFISSQTHRIHHSYLPQHFDKNFVAFFPIWDILFGTYYHPARDEFPLTGVEGEKEIQSVWEVQIFALREWRKMFRARRAVSRSRSDSQ
jgi:sterol desaturase/sphingolipid hydroxylase (fatty acid hydroxylase superfamily)